jgi:hypothetical protein
MRTLALAVSTIITLAAVTSCAAHPSSTTSGHSSAKDIAAMMTPDQAKQEVRVLYEATRDLMPGDWFEDTHGWVQCFTPRGEEGAYYDFFSQRRAQPLPADPKTIVERAQTVWARLGHPVQVDRDETLTPPRYVLSEPAWMAGSGPDGLLLQFTVGDDYADFIGTSRCVVGDSLELGLGE